MLLQRLLAASASVPHNHDVRAATAEIRRLVYGLRPPLLDEFGLLGALRNLELTSDALTRTVVAPDALPPLPAAVEVALYHIAAEALHNIVRHAHATHCTLCLAVDAASAPSSSPITAMDYRQPTLPGWATGQSMNGRRNWAVVQV